MDPDVVIVGGGPVGTGLAIDLALHGLSVTVVERREAIQQIPKGQNLTPRTGEHFRRWGVTDAIRAASPIPRSYGSGGIATYGTFERSCPTIITNGSTGRGSSTITPRRMNGCHNMRQKLCFAGGRAISPTSNC